MLAFGRGEEKKKKVDSFVQRFSEKNADVLLLL